MLPTSFPIAGANQQKPGQRSSEPRVALKEESKPPAEFQSSCCCDHRANVQAHLEALNVQLVRIAKTLETAMQSTTDTMKPRARAVSSDNAKPTIVLNLPGVRLAVLTSACDSLLQFDVTLSSVVSLLLAAYVACVLAWNILAFVLGLLAHAAAFAFVTFHTFMGLSMLSTNTTTTVQHYSIPELKKKTPANFAAPTLPLLYVGDAVIPSKSTHADGTTASKRKELQAPAARRRVLAHLNRNRLLVNVVPGDMRRRVDMNLSEANIRVGKAFLQNVPGKRKPRDIYVVRIDCGAQSATQEKHMNPVVMWDVTASFEEFKRLEHDLKKEIKAKKQSRVKVPHLSSGAVLFVQPELTNDVLNARRVRLQTFIDTVRSDPVLSTMGCLRKFCQAY
ncbi:hypothetical protein DVH05_007957 [Phytophthora capsici]|nr:hypothetical protein DVH05_007957 [Phytophthora capsici]